MAFSESGVILRCFVVDGFGAWAYRCPDFSTGDDGRQPNLGARTHVETRIQKEMPMYRRWSSLALIGAMAACLWTSTAVVRADEVILFTSDGGGGANC